MNPAIKVSEQLVLISTLSPATVNSTPAYSDAIDMSKFHRVYAVYLLGNMSNETIDLSMESDTTDAFSTPTAVVAATQLAASASANDNKEVILEVKSEDLAAGEKYLRAKVVTGNTGGGPVAVAILGVPRFSNEADLSSVVEIKAA